MGRRSNQQKGPVVYKGFINIPQVVLNSERYIKLHPRSVKLLLDIARQYNGYNNGDLQATMSCLKKWGWNSNSHLTQATRQLRSHELIVQTRQGGLGMGCSLYALSWQPINECGGKLDMSPTTDSPVNWLKEEKELNARGELFNKKFRPQKPKLR